MTEKEKRQQRVHAEDAVFNRMLLWLIGAVIAEAVALFVKRIYTSPGINADISNVVDLIIFVFSYVGVLLTVLCVIWCVLAIRKGKTLRVPIGCTAIAAFIWFLTGIISRFGIYGVGIITIAPIVAIILILIYFLYHRAFFVNSIVTACGMLALWGVRNFGRTSMAVAVIFGWIGLAAIIVLSLYIKKNSGYLGKCKLVSDSKCYPVFWISCGVVFALTLLGFILGAGFAYYLIFVLVGWLFCLAVYYTVKLM